MKISILFNCPLGAEGAVPSENTTYPLIPGKQPSIIYIQHFIAFILNLVFLAKKDISFKISNTVEALLNNQLGNSKKWS